MLDIAKKTRVLQGCRPEDLPLAELLASGEPAVLKGIARQWGIVQAGLRSDQEAMDYLQSFYNGKPLGFSQGDRQIGGRLFYDEQLTQLNFTTHRARMEEVLAKIKEHFDEESPPTLYIGSAPVESYLPGFRGENDLGLQSQGVDAPPAIWIGNRTVASCHYDAPNNLACCVVGCRRFTMFPPEQIFNLYPGSLELTPGGQAVSLVDFADPDFERHPRFRAAIAAGEVAELEPGDAVFVPSMWWHHVQALSSFNALVNYWWSSAPSFISTPMNALYHAIWTIRDRPEREKRAWQDVFDYYVFGPSERAGAHLPERARGILGPLDELAARQVRAMLISKLNR